MNTSTTTLRTLLASTALLLPLVAVAGEPAADAKSASETRDAAKADAAETAPIPASVWTPTDPGRRWTYVYVRERSRTLDGGEAEVEKLHGTRVDEVASTASDFGDDVVRVDSVLRAKSSLSPNEFEEDHTGFYRTAGTTFELVAEKNSDPTKAVEVLVRYDVPLTLLESGAEPGQHWNVGVRSQGDVHTNLEGEVLGVQDVETPAGLFQQCLVIRLTGQISGVVEAYGSRMEVPSGDFTVTRWYAPGTGLVLAKEERSQTLVLEDGSQMDYSERTQFALRSADPAPPAATTEAQP